VIIAPDLLHQIKKGVWSHLLNWFQYLLQDIHEVRKANEYLDEMDKRFVFVPRFMGIKSFPKGIRCMEQITAGEYAHIMKVPENYFILIGIYSLGVGFTGHPVVPRYSCHALGDFLLTKKA